MSVKRRVPYLIMQLQYLILIHIALAAPNYNENITVSTFAVGLGSPSGICRDGKSNIFYSVDAQGPLRKFHQNGSITTFKNTGWDSQDCVVDSLHNIYIGIIFDDILAQSSYNQILKVTSKVRNMHTKTRVLLLYSLDLLLKLLATSTEEVIKRVSMNHKVLLSLIIQSLLLRLTD
jgi:hypothetical protein